MLLFACLPGPAETANTFHDKNKVPAAAEREEQQQQQQQEFVPFFEDDELGSGDDNRDGFEVITHLQEREGKSAMPTDNIAREEERSTV